VPPRTGATLIDHHELKERPTPYEHNQSAAQAKKQNEFQQKPAPQAQKTNRCAGKKTLTSATNPDQSQTDT
jgi:hypothetical protein